MQDRNLGTDVKPAGGDNLKTTIIEDGKPMVVQDYAKVQAIFIGCIVAYTLVLIVMGPEYETLYLQSTKRTKYVLEQKSRLALP